MLRWVGPLPGVVAGLAGDPWSRWTQPAAAADSGKGRTGLSVHIRFTLKQRNGNSLLYSFSVYLTHTQT